MERAARATLMVLLSLVAGCGKDPKPAGAVADARGPVAADAAAAAPMPTLGLREAPAPTTSVALVVERSSWSPPPLWDPEKAVARRLREAGLGVVAAGEAGAAATVHVTYREDRGPMYRRNDGARVPSSKIAMTIAITSADGARKVTLPFTGKPSSWTSSLESAMTDDLFSQPLWRHQGTIAAYVAGAADRGRIMAVAAHESAHPEEKSVASMYRQLGLAVSTDEERAYLQLRKYNDPWCTTHREACAAAAVPMIAANATWWFGSGTYERIARALGLLAAHPQPDGAVALGRLADAMIGERDHRERRAPLITATIAALAATGSPLALRPLGALAEIDPSATAAAARVRAALAAARPPGPRRVVVDVHLADPLVAAPDLRPFLEAHVRRAGLEPIAPDGGGADGYLLAEYRTVPGGAFPGHELELRVIELRRGAAETRVVGATSGERLVVADLLPADAAAELARKLAALAAP